MKQGLTFLPFVPSDELVLQSDENAIMMSETLSESLDTLKYLNEDLSMLLRLPIGQFVGHLLYNETLAVFLDGFLRHKSRTFDLMNAVTGGKLHYLITSF